MRKAICEHCGRTFETWIPTARYCSDACRQAAYRLRLANKQAEQPKPDKAHDNQQNGR